jgi:acylphosphatase
MAEMVRARIRVVGIVQGVAFRQSTVHEARRLGLAGHVRNLPDGSVEVEAEGVRAQIEALVRWCERGPPSARVERVDVEWGTAAGDRGPFSIRW